MATPREASPASRLCLRSTRFGRLPVDVYLRLPDADRRAINAEHFEATDLTLDDALQIIEQARDSEPWDSRKKS